MAQSVVTALERSNVRTHPFVYLIMTDIFASDLLDSLIRLLPDDMEYRRFRALDSVDTRNPYRSSWRLKLDDRAPASPSDSFRSWVAIADALKTGAVRDAFLKALRVKASDASRLKVGVRLYRDEGGSTIGPHTDGPDKVVTCIFYLPGDGDLIGCGTRILEPCDPALVPPTDEEYEHSRFYGQEDRFREVTEIPYRSNSAMAMARSSSSFHSVQIPITAPARYSLMYRLIRP